MRLSEAERAARSAAARAAFFRDGRIPAGIVGGEVWRSWKRCQAAGQEPALSIGFDTIGRSRVAEIEEHSHDLIAAARQEVADLAAAVARAEMVVLLADATGAILHVAGDVGRCSRRLRLAARSGVDLGERTVGTNAVGTALVERRALSIVAREHYFESNSALTCTAAPVFDPFGALSGALDVSGDHRQARPDCAELVIAAACAIENSLLRRLRDVVVVTISPRPELLGTPWEGVLAFDPTGQLVAGNARALAAVGIAQRSGAQFAELFGPVTLSDMLDRQRADARPLVLDSFAGLRFAAHVERPRESGTARRGSLPRPCGMPCAARGDGSKRSSMLALLQCANGDARTAREFGKARSAQEIGLPVLIAGETGTGKELAARGLHQSSPRRERPFVAVNCAALPEALVEAELFGYVDGAFTGACRGGAAGKIEVANGGTLFPDEIGDMPLVLQSRLLRVLEERVIVRLGEIRERPVDFALLCATHRDPQDLVARGLLREDLYYRINGLQITLPPLRARTNLAELAAFFLSLRSPRIRIPQLSAPVLELFARHQWPGNLRQLDHVLTQVAAFLADADDLVEPRHLPEGFGVGCQTPAACDVRSAAAVPGSLADVTTDLIERTVNANAGNVSAAARALKISRSTIYNRRRNA